MQRYKNANESGVQFFNKGKDFIELMFEDGGIYLYDSKKPGKLHVEKMKILADKGSDLNSYINKYVRANFAKKLK